MVTCVVEFNEENNKKTKKFLSTFPNFVKNIKEFELIFVIKADDCNLVDYISEFTKQYSFLNVKIVYSTKTLSINKQLKFAAYLSSTNYIWIIDPSIEYSNDLFKNVINLLKNDDIDLIEIQPKLNGWIKWNPKSRHNLKPSTKLLINDNEKILAYIFPFIKNKIFSKKIVSTILNNKKLHDSFDISTNLSIEFLYLFLLKIKSYSWIQSKQININISQNDIPHYKHILNEWENITSFYKSENKFISELNYAKAYHLLIIITSLYGVRNISTIFKESHIYKEKYYNKLIKLWQTEMKFFNVENKYMINKNNENDLLYQVPSINKWGKILSIL